MDQLLSEKFHIRKKAYLSAKLHTDLPIWQDKELFPREDLENFAEVCLFSYAKKEIRPERKAPSLWSLSSRGLDYHQVVRKYLQAYAQDLIGRMEADQARKWQGSYQAYVDTQPYSERALALEAGLGWIGKNQNLIHEDLGSFVYIGLIYWQVEEVFLPYFSDTESDSVFFNKDQFQDKSEKYKTDRKKNNKDQTSKIRTRKNREKMNHPCSSCNRCVDLCPGQALARDGSYDRDQCISYLTQSKKDLSLEEADKIGQHLYGCDQCQLVCPLNKDLEQTRIKEFLWSPDQASEEAIDFLSYSNQELEERHGYRSGRWRGWNILRRNALINVRTAYKEGSLSLEEYKSVLDHIHYQSPHVQAVKNLFIEELDKKKI